MNIVSLLTYKIPAMNKTIMKPPDILLALILFSGVNSVSLSQVSKQDSIPPKIIELSQGIKLVIDANINLSDTVSIQILDGIRNILPGIQKLIPADSATIKLAISTDHILPVWGIGSRTLSGYNDNRKEETVEINYDPNHPNFRVEYIMRTLAHELHHVCRVRMPDFQVSLLECMVNEGLADHFMLEVLHCEQTSWSKALTEEQIHRYMIQVKPLMYEKYESWTKDLDIWMLYGEPGPGAIPGWTGYSIGWRIVENYLKAHPEARASSLVFTAPEEIVSATPELMGE
jgi:hypothetical protein